MRKDLLSGLGLLVIATGFCWAATGIQVSTLSDDFGPQGFPIALAVCLGVVSIGLIGRALLARSAAASPLGPSAEEGKDEPDEATLPRALGLLAIGAGYVAIVRVIGYVPAIALLIAAVALYEGLRPSLRLRGGRDRGRRVLLAPVRTGSGRAAAARPRLRLCSCQAAAPGDRLMQEFLSALSLLVTTPLVPVALLRTTWGIIGGALPGISPSITMALLLPFTYTLDPMPAIVLLAVTYIGAEYGGSIPAILIRTPGTNAAAATVIDGYEMKRQGRAGEALGISLWSGVVGSLFGLAMLVLLTEPLSRLALAFTPMSYFGLGVLGLSVIASLSGKSLLEGPCRRHRGHDDRDHRHRPDLRREPVHLRLARISSPGSSRSL